MAKIERWGNSQGLRLPKSVLRQANMTVGDAVQIRATQGHISVRPAAAVRGKYRLEDLLLRIPKGYKPREVEWGRPVGREVW